MPEPDEVHDTDPCAAPFPAPPPLPREARRTIMSKAVQSQGVQWTAILTAVLVGVGGLVQNCNDSLSTKLDAIDGKVDLVIERVGYAEERSREQRREHAELKKVVRTLRSRVDGAEERVRSAGL